MRLVRFGRRKFCRLSLPLDHPAVIQIVRVSHQQCGITGSARSEGPASTQSLQALRARTNVRLGSSDSPFSSVTTRLCSIPRAVRGNCSGPSFTEILHRPSPCLRVQTGLLRPTRVIAGRESQSASTRSAITRYVCSSWDFRFARPGWPLYTPKGSAAHETLVRHSIVPLQRPSA